MKDFIFENILPPMFAILVLLVIVFLALCLWAMYLDLIVGCVK